LRPSAVPITIVSCGNDSRVFELERFTLVQRALHQPVARARGLALAWRPRSRVGLGVVAVAAERCASRALTALEESWLEPDNDPGEHGAIEELQPPAKRMSVIKKPCFVPIQKGGEE